MESMKKNRIRQTTCGSLLFELQTIWDEVGETETDKDRMLLELERDCLEVYRRKFDQARQCRANLKRDIADAEAELDAIWFAMGELRAHNIQSNQSGKSLKQKLGTISSELEVMQKRKTDRRNQFALVLEDIANITNHIEDQGDDVPSKPQIDETDLSTRKLKDLECKLQELQIEKSARVETIRNHLCSVELHCSVLGLDFNVVVGQVNPTLCDPEGPRSLSDHTIKKLEGTVQELREDKIQRIKKLQDLATKMLELWNLLDTPIELQQEYQHIICKIAASEHEITEANSLSEDVISNVEKQVVQLNEEKASKMKELEDLVQKKRSELEDIYKETHMLPVSDSVIDQTIPGIVEAKMVLEHLEQRISKIKEEALSRKEILEKVQDWVTARADISWLEEYNRDENRHKGEQGAYLDRARAEKARKAVKTFPGMVKAVASKITAWEQENGIEFLYDGTGLRSMLDK